MRLGSSQLQGRGRPKSLRHRVSVRIPTAVEAKILNNGDSRENGVSCYVAFWQGLSSRLRGEPGQNGLRQSGAIILLRKS